VENQFDFIGELNQKDRAKAHWKDLNDQIERIGGVDRALFSFLPLDLKLELKDAPKGIPTARQGQRKPTSWPACASCSKRRPTPTSSAWMKRIRLQRRREGIDPQAGCRSSSASSRRSWSSRSCARLENAPRDLGIVAQESLEDGDITAKVEQRIIDAARLVLTAKDETKRLKGKVDKSLVEVVDFRYEPEVRMAAAKMLNDKTGTYRGWATDAKGDLNKALKDDIDGALNIANLKDFKDSMLSRTLREWYLKQQDILGLLPP
jgi:hypothetical protein